MDEDTHGTSEIGEDIRFRNVSDPVIFPNNT